MQSAEVERIVAAFNDATNRHDVDEMLALVSDAVVFEGTTPPDGVRIEGDKAALRALWEGIFRDSPNVVIHTKAASIAACSVPVSASGSAGSRRRPAAGRKSVRSLACPAEAEGEGRASERTAKTASP